MHALKIYVCSAVVYVLGGASQDAKDAHGETALLLDMLDLILHTVTATSIIDDPAQLIDGNAESSPSADIYQQPTEKAVADSHSREASDSNAAGMHGLAECVLWGLHALSAAAKQIHGSQPCAAMLSEYVVERFVAFSKDWPLEVAQTAAEVRLAGMARLYHTNCHGSPALHCQQSVPLAHPASGPATSSRNAGGLLVILYSHWVVHLLEPSVRLILVHCLQVVCGLHMHCTLKQTATTWSKNALNLALVCPGRPQSWHTGVAVL